MERFRGCRGLVKWTTANAVLDKWLFRSFLSQGYEKLQETVSSKEKLPYSLGPVITWITPATYPRTSIEYTVAVSLLIYSNTVGGGDILVLRMGCTHGVATQSKLENIESICTDSNTRLTETGVPCCLTCQLSILTVKFLRVFAMCGM